MTMKEPLLREYTQEQIDEIIRSAKEGAWSEGRQAQKMYAKTVLDGIDMAPPANPYRRTAPAWERNS